MSPLPRMEITQSFMGALRELWMLTKTVRGWCCSAVSGICGRCREHWAAVTPSPPGQPLCNPSVTLLSLPSHPNSQLTSLLLYLVLHLLLPLIHHWPSLMVPFLHFETLESFPLSLEFSFGWHSEPFTSWLQSTSLGLSVLPLTKRHPNLFGHFPTPAHPSGSRP